MRRFPFAIGVVMAVALWSPLSAQVETAVAPINTSGGRVAGTGISSTVKAWLGIPYAQSPTGDLRWRPPQPRHWNGVWGADRFGPECMQYLRPHTLNQYYGEEATSENCLFLNIWAPASAKEGDNLAVVVFIHGGGSSIGSGSLPEYNGENIARRGAIFVTFNYRLGLLGFLAHPALTQEQGGRSGNYGYLDQVAALQWVHDNIARFGGDLGHVVIFGQSSGGISAFLHLLSPVSRGLFSAAVLSASCCSFHQSPLSEGEATGLALQRALGADSLAAMRDAPADKILDQQGEGQNLAHHAGLRAGAVIDGYFSPKPYQDMLDSRAFADVPILFTSNSDDNDWSRNPFTAAKSVADYTAIATKLFDDKAPEFLKLYPVRKDSDVPATVALVVKDAGMQSAARDCAATFHQLTQRDSKVFIGWYDRKEPFAPGIKYADMDTATAGAYHNADTPYWFGAYEAYNSLKQTRVFTPADAQMSAAMMDALIAFAKTGDPSTSAVTWPAWTHDGQQRIVIDHHIHLEKLNARGMDWLARSPLDRSFVQLCPASH